VLGPVLHVAAVGSEPALGFQFLVHVAVVLCEAPLLGDVDLLATGELELGASESFYHLRLETIARSHAHDRLTDAHTSHGALGFAEGASHSGLKPISSGTR